MLKVAAAALAVPILIVVYLSSVLRRSALVRGGVALGLGGILALGVVLAAQPAPVAATPPSQPVPLTDAAFGPVVTTGAGLGQTMTITFSAPMDPASVDALTTVLPATDVRLSWDPADTTLTIAPTVGWRPATYHTVTVAAGALARSGQPLLSPVHTAFLTRGAATLTIAATERLASRVSASTAFDVDVSGSVSTDAATAAIQLRPVGGTTATPVAGTVTTVDGAAAGTTSFRFTPTDGLHADTKYRLVVSGLHDADGVAIPTASLLVRTVAAASVVRFRPRADTLGVARDATLSVRFTAPMDRAATAKAFTVTANGKPVAGKVSWAEGDEVLVFKPTAALPYKATVAMTVAATARSTDGVAIAASARGLFRTVPKPVVTPASHGTGGGSGGGGSSGGGGGGGGSSGGGAVGGGSWGSVEVYYLGLMNCTRTGGWVTSSGACSSPGGRNVAALKLDSGISSKVSRPYAKKLAVGNDCSHFIGGNPGDRLSAAGYHSYRWAENIGCRSGSAKSAVLGSHLFFQDEKSSNGGHYVNLMNAAYDRVGIGVWVSSGRVRLVIDFYHP